MSSTYKVLVTYDFSNIPAVNLPVESGTVLPSVGLTEGRVFLKSDVGLLYYFTNGAWHALGTADTVPPHTHPISDIIGLQTALDGKAPLVHTHVISDITGLQAALDSKSDANHTHPNATETDPGFMSAADKVKLDGIEDGAQANTVASVFGRTGVIVATAGDYSADLISNSPAGNIASTTVQAALNELDTKKVSTDDFTAALATKSDVGHTHLSTDITDFSTAVANQIVAYFDTTAGTDNDLDTLRELIDQIKANRDELGTLVKRASGTLGDGAATDISVSHNLASNNLIVQVYDYATNDAVGVAFTLDNSNVITFHFAEAPAADAYRYVILA